MPDCLASLCDSVVAIATPFRDTKLDPAALTLLCERQIARGTAALVVCGSTGEAPALSQAEQAKAIRVTAKEACGRVPVIAGCSAASTDATVVLAAAAACCVLRSELAAVRAAALRETNSGRLERAHPGRFPGGRPANHAL